MTETATACESCGQELGARAVERGFRRCYACFIKSRSAAIGPGQAGPASSLRHGGQAPDENLKAEPGEGSSVIAVTEPKEGDEINGWPVIFSYTTEQAVADGVLVYVGDVGRNRVYFTRNLFEQGYEELEKRRELVERGLDLLRRPDAEDTPYMLLRVIDDEKWVIAEPGKLTYMLPSDY